MLSQRKHRVVHGFAHGGVGENHNGKIDFKALAAGGHSDSKGEDSCLLPAQPSELLIAEICKEVLNIEKVNVSDNFIEVGGDSISAIRFINKFEEYSGVRISFPELLLQTLGQLANSIDDKLKKEKNLGVGVKR